MPEPYVPALGRISGKLLQPNLTRNGSDLTFRNRQTDDDLLYLDVSNLKIGINTDTPSFDLTVSNWTADSQTLTTNLKVTTQAVIADFIISASDITTQNDPIEIVMTGNDPVAYFDRLSSDGKIVFDDNKISGDGSSNIEFDAAGTGKIELLANTVAHSDVNVTGTIELGGNLSTEGDIIIGDSRLDRVIVNTDLTQDILPGSTLTYNLGASNRRWSEAHIPNWTTITNLIPSAALVSEQTYLGGPTNLITTVQSNEDLVLEPGTGILYVDENFKLETVPGSPDNLLHTLENPNPNSLNLNDYFGSSVDISESYTIVGAYREDDTGGLDSGKAYIFSNATGNLLHTLDNPNAYGTSASDFFGYSVGISESYAIVGAYAEDDVSGTSSGKAYIFDTATGTLVHTLDDPNPYLAGAGDNFGWSVGISESYAIVGAYQEDEAGAASSGKAYLYDLNNYSLTTYSLQFEFGRADNSDGSFVIDLTSLGIPTNERILKCVIDSVDIRGDLSSPSFEYIELKLSTATTYDIYTSTADDATYRNKTWLGNSDLPLGATSFTVDFQIPSGVNFSPIGMPNGYFWQVRFNLSVSTTTGMTILNNPNAYGTSTSDYFGYSVGISESYAIVGAHLEDDVSGTSSGKAYIFDTTTSSLLHTLDNPNAYSTGAGDNFGWSVGISESYAIVGAYAEDDDDGVNSGKAYIFDTTTGSLLHILNNPNAYGTSASDYFGYSVGISETHAVVGAHFEDGDGVFSSGRTYVYNIGRYDSISQNIQFEYGAANNNDGSFTVPIPDLSGYDNPTVIIDSVDIRGDLSSPSTEYIELKLSTASTYDTYTSIADDAAYRNYAWLGGNPQINESSSFTVDFQIPSGVNFSPPGMPNSYFWQVRLNIRVNAFKGMTTLTHPSGALVAERFGLVVRTSGSNIAISTMNTSNYGTVYIFGAVNAITNLSETLPVTIGSTGNGYTRFVGTNGMLIPAGTSAERTFSEVGETRWNTEEGYLECYDGNVYIVATGPGETVTEEIMTELAIVRSLILG